MTEAQLDKTARTTDCVLPSSRWQRASPWGLRIRQALFWAWCCVLLAVGCAPGEKPTAQEKDASQSSVSTTHAADDAVLEQQVRQFCGDCHAVPRPESFPKDNWLHEVRRGFDFYVKSGRSDLDVPVMTDVARYYRERAPDRLEWKPASAADADSLFLANSQKPAELWSDGEPSISFVTAGGTRDAPAWWVSDMQRGEIAQVDANGQRVRSINGLVRNPVAVRATDLNQDGNEDLLVAELGSFLPEDHDRGAVRFVSDWQQKQPSQAVSLLDGVGRIADLQVADLNDDGRPDIVAAEFGWHTTGGVHVLLQQGNSTADDLQFEHQRLDQRAGAIHVRVVDLNNDRRPDIVALLAQEYEQIVAYINRGQRFETVVLWAAPDPSFGSSGISVVDFDQDGDLDLLYTNGDTFDSFLVKPYHGVSWLENVGPRTGSDNTTALDANERRPADVPHFIEHRIGTLPGVHRALAADFDLDGDTDVAAVALIPDQTLDDIDHPMESVVWFENRTGSGDQGQSSFARHVVAVGRPGHAALEISDVDDDGDSDLIVGHFSSADGSSPITVYRNQTR